MEEILNAAPTEEELAEQARIRHEKLQKLVSEGNDPFVKVKYEVSANSAQVKNGFEQLEGKEVSLAGRLMSRRIMGKASFSHIQDGATTSARKIMPRSKRTTTWAISWELRATFSRRRRAKFQFTATV